MRGSVRILAICSAATIGMVPAVASGSAAAAPPGARIGSPGHPRVLR